MIRLYFGIYEEFNKLVERGLFKNLWIKDIKG